MKKWLLFLTFGWAGMAAVAQDLTHTGDEKMKKGDCSGAVEVYRKAFSKSSKPENALRLGSAYYCLQDYQKAEIYTTKATLAGDKSIASDAFMYRGLTRIAAGKETSGEYDLKKALALNPQNAEVYRRRAMFFYIPDKQFVSAVQDLNAFTLYAPKSAESYKSLAEEIIKTGISDYDLLSKAYDFLLTASDLQKNAVSPALLADVKARLVRLKPATTLAASEIVAVNQPIAKTTPEVAQLPAKKTETAKNTPPVKQKELPVKEKPTEKSQKPEADKILAKQEKEKITKPEPDKTAVKENKTEKVVVAEDRKNKTEKAEPEKKVAKADKTVVYDNDVTIDLDKLRKKAKVWAVVVGISVYTKNTSLNLHYADADARLFHDFLHSVGGGSVPESQMAIIANENATAPAIRKAMKDTYSRAGSDDVVILYVASHGYTEDREFYFLTTEAEVGNLKNTALSRENIGQALRGCKARKKMVFADACHSGNLGYIDLESTAPANIPDEPVTSAKSRSDRHKSKSEPQARGIEEKTVKVSQTNAAPAISEQTAEQLEASSKLLIEMAQVNEGHAIMTAATGGQKSLEDARWGGGHGAFTYFLTEGLKGKADIDKNKLVTFSELNDYVYRSVTEATERKQQPIFQGTFDGNFPMSVVVRK
jgi:tetratricopeptide (TPR) repeat protein